MNRKHVAQQTQRERNCSPSNGTERLTSSRIARVGVSALIAGQLMMPGISLAAEDTDQNVVQANSTATVAAEKAAPAPTASNDATNGTQASKESAAAPEAQSAPKANPSQTDTSQKASAETAASTASNQNEAAATSQTPAPPANNAMPTDAIQTRGVTDVTDNQVVLR